MLPKGAPANLSVFNLSCPDPANPTLEWYLDITEIAWCKRPVTDCVSDRVQELGSPHTPTASLQALPGIDSPEAVLRQGVPYSEYEPVPILPRSTHKASGHDSGKLRRPRKSKPSAARIRESSKTPRRGSSIRRRSFSIVPDSDGEPAEVLRSATVPVPVPQEHGSRTQNITPQPPVEKHDPPIDIPTLIEEIYTTPPEPIDELQVSSLNLNDIDLSSVPEYQSEAAMFSDLQQAIVDTQAKPPPQHFLEFAGSYSVLVDPTLVLNERIVCNIAVELPKFAALVYR